MIARDAAPPRRDAPIGACDRLAFGPSVTLEGPGGVTPRLVALDGGDVGLVYVNTNDGDPIAVYYERLDDRLGRATGAVRVSAGARSWAEPARSGDGLAIAFALDFADSRSALVHVDRDGRPSAPEIPVGVENPSVLEATASGFFWMAFEMRAENAYQLAHVAPDGALLHEVQRIEVGRYGSDHAAVALPDGRGHLLAYASEGPRGVRRARVNAITEDGVLAGERTLEMEGADAVVPVLVGGELRIVWRSDDALVVSALDAETLEVVSERRLPRLEGDLFAATIEERFVVGASRSPSVVALDLGDGEEEPVRLESAIPGPGAAGGVSWAPAPGALVLALGVTSGAEAFPWIVRLECAE
jgi:hypothetical protein